MSQLSRILSVALIAITLVHSGEILGAEADKAKTASQLLMQGSSQYQGLDFVKAKEKFLQAYDRRDELTDPQRKSLADYLGKVDGAIAGKVAAEATYNAGEDAMAKGDFELAKSSFGKVASSKYLPAKVRKEAKTKMATATLALNTGEAPASVIAAPKSGAVAPVATDAAPSSDLTAAQRKSLVYQQRMSEGDKAMSLGDHQKAATCYQNALEAKPGDEKAQDSLQSARIFTARSTSSGLLQNIRDGQKIRRQMADHDMRKAIARANELMAVPADTQNEKNFDAADQAMQTAKNILENKKNSFPESEYKTRLATINEKIDWIEKRRDVWNREQVKAKMAAVDEESRNRESRNRKRQEQKVQELVTRARALRREQKYTEAYSLLKQILELDPSNLWAADNMFTLQQFITLQEQKRALDSANIEISKQSADIARAMIPWYDKVRYPRDWARRCAEKKPYGAASASESDEDRRVRQRLLQRLSVRLIEQEFPAVIEYLREVSSVNIYVNWGALENDQPDIRTAQVTVQLKDVTVQKALEVILDDAGGGLVELGYVIEQGVVNIDTKERLNEKTYPRVYDIRDLLIRIPNFIGTRVDLSSIGEQGSNSEGGGSGGGGGLFDEDEEEGGGASAEDTPLTRSEMAAKVQELLKQTVANDSWYPNGMATINELNGNLVITQTAQNHTEIQQLIAKMRETRTIQVAVEARFITIRSGYLSQIGVDLDVIFNIGSPIYGPQQPPYPIPVPPATGGAPPLWAGAGLDPYTGSVVPFNQNASSWNQAGANASQKWSNLSPVGMMNNSMQQVNMLGQDTIVPNGVGSWASTAAMTVAGTFMDDIQVDFMIEATEADSSSRTLTAPRLTLLNGQRAYVSIAINQAYVAGFDPIVSDAALGVDPIISYGPTGTLLDIDATVNHDRRYVTMTMRPQVVRFEINDPPLSVGAGQAAGTLVQVNVPVYLPTITLQEVMTTVSVPDGGTLLLGGQRLGDQREREMGVPFVSKIPVINRAFTNKSMIKDEESLIILVKPSIIIQEERELDERLRTAKDTFEFGMGN